MPFTSRRAVGLVAAVALSSPLAVAATAGPAAADTGSCVTKSEFHKVSKGMHIGRVHRIFDINGHQTYFSSGSQYFPAEQWREYKACVHPKYSTVEVDYKKRNGDWVVTSKYASFF